MFETGSVGLVETLLFFFFFYAICPTPSHTFSGIPICNWCYNEFKIPHYFVVMESGNFKISQMLY